MLHIDGSHFIIPLYDGVLINITAKTGYGTMLLLAAAWVPTESKEHLTFVILMLVRSGFNFNQFPIMTDRGPLLSVASVIADTHGISLSLKFCLEHIIRNISHQFSLDLDDQLPLRNAMAILQSSETIGTFLTKIDDVIKIYKDKGIQIARYVMKIHPRH